jgi:Protein of unknown function (DUF4242)
MARRPAAESRATYLVEHYRPGLQLEELDHAVVRVRDAVSDLEREGKRVRFRRSTIVPADESFLCVIEAASEELVREAYARGGIPFERISNAIDQGGRT